MKIKPIPLWQSLLIFGIPGTMILLGTYFVVPVWVNKGLNLIWSWTLVLLISLSLTAGFLIIKFFLEPENNYDTFKKRFRLNPIKKSDWKWIVIALFSIIILNFAFEWTQPIIRKLFPEQPILPEIFADPYAAVSGNSEVKTFFGWPMKDNYWLILFWLIWLAVLVPLEEIIWRGYALPRMELKYGKWAFLVNGLLWNIPFHMYTFWNILTDLPMFLIIPLVAMKTKSTWSSIILHFTLPLLALFYLIPGIVNN